ncbi:MAG TPA: acyl-CoA dehydrogenase family protein [Kofleriaceae bacterium]|nr:acyl-CoA dehydrogenase family protein [Kofleriaceae bacterium]
MKFAFTDEQLELQRVVRDLLARECPPARVRAAWDGAHDAPLAVWPQLAGVGVVGMTAPERFGGLGMDELDLALVLEEAGRAALPEPLLEHTAVAIPLVAETCDDAFCDRWLGAAAAGKVTLAVRLGDAPFVASAARARLLLLEHPGARGVELHAVEPSAVSLVEQTSVDGARKLARVEWQPSADTCVARGPHARAALDRAFERAAFASAAELIGVARKLMEMTVEYVKLRQQFGKAVGSFQAVKHMLAEAHVAIELARPCVHRAAYALARREADASDPAVHVSMAKAYASDAANRAARAALQCHGAIGYSFEYDLHLWMKRAWVQAAAYGDAAWHRTRIASLVLDQGVSRG